MCPSALSGISPIALDYAVFLVCPQIIAWDGKTEIVTATVSDIKKAEQGKGQMDSKNLVRVPSRAVAAKLYREAEEAIAKRESMALPSHGGRFWKVDVRLADDGRRKRKHASALFRWYRGRLELAAVPHFLERIEEVDAGLSVGRHRDDPSDSESSDDEEDLYSHIPKTDISQREVSALSTVAWDDPDHTIPKVQRTWRSPDLRTFQSRSGAIEHAKSLLKRDKLVDKVLHGFGARGVMCRPVKPTRKAALDAGLARFLRDGLWVVGQEDCWLEDALEVWKVREANKVKREERESEEDALELYIEAHIEEELEKEKAKIQQKEIDQTATEQPKSGEAAIIEKSSSEQEEERKGEKETEEKDEERGDDPEEEESEEEESDAESDSDESEEESVSPEEEAATAELTRQWEQLGEEGKKPWFDKADANAKTAADVEAAKSRAKTAARIARVAAKRADEAKAEEEEAAAEVEEKLAEEAAEKAAAAIEAADSGEAMSLEEPAEAKPAVPADEESPLITPGPKEEEPKKKQKVKSNPEVTKAKARLRAAKKAAKAESKIAAVAEAAAKSAAAEAEEKALAAESSRQISVEELAKIKHPAPLPFSCPTAEQPTKKLKTESAESCPSTVAETVANAPFVDPPLQTETDKEKREVVDGKSFAALATEALNKYTAEVARVTPTPNEFSSSAISSNGSEDAFPLPGAASSNIADASAPTDIAVTEHPKRSVSRKPPTFATSTHWRLNQKQIDLCNAAVTDHYQKCMYTIKARNLIFDLADGFDVIRERGRGRYDMELEAFDKPEFSFLSDLKKAAWMPIVRKILGDNVALIHKGAFISLPGAAAQVYHQDGVHQHKSIQKPCYAVNVFLPLVDLDESKGPTEFCLGTHYLGNEHYVRDFCETPTPPAGTPIIFDYRLGHRGMGNSSAESRPIVYLTYTSASSEFKDKVNFSRKRYKKLGDFAEKPLSRRERAQMRG